MHVPGSQVCVVPKAVCQMCTRKRLFVVKFVDNIDDIKVCEDQQVAVIVLVLLTTHTRMLIGKSMG